MPTNLCKHFECPHYEKNRCQRYDFAGICPVNEINGVTDEGRSLSINLDRLNRDCRALIKCAIQMTMENA